MIYEIPVSTGEIQEQSFSLFGMNLRLTLYFNPVLNGWQFDLLNTNTGEQITRLQGLTVNAPALLERKLPFVLVLADGSGLGINSLQRGELGNRLMLYAVETEVWREAIRTNATA
ncbi:hypothetical protein PT300_11545 [Enterobacteriaceae bacterium ESL0689]|nr:hypothetical protein [Enterobacteriaceae bacterium ESL0689]MDF7681180.1 hypothetical protein [Enterobacteriaceae bacterium ESL0689]